MVRLTDRPAMTIAVDLGRKATKQTKPYPKQTYFLFGLTSRVEVGKCVDLDQMLL